MFPVILVCIIEIISKVAGNSTFESYVNIYDLTRPTSWRELSAFYNAVDRQWKMCMSCGVPTLGTSMHLELSDTVGSVHPAVIPAEYLLSRLLIIDVTVMRIQPTTVLTVEIALQWTALRQDPMEPTFLVFKFGWTMNNDYNKRYCDCKVPGISYELAQWIATNMSHIVGVGTDAPTLESKETRNFTIRTVANALGNNGIYIIENINLKRNIPEHGCLVLTTPLKLINYNIVPTRLTAFCPVKHKNKEMVVLKTIEQNLHRYPAKRAYEINLEEIME